ncbi:uncharacterized protein LOC133506772 isoform X2 [Syngnathoides biaculeatus]|uniref:uncharacterized protein LOC133506772 isoform X2 n=1 Tax=Syngnathoides biaculeatus TaxID=300417 RepID=UPI002ADE49F4|nr:uncharacterized protein LOC133506772 isoform X2 [Syngnathoides biaculeatus]
MRLSSSSLGEGIKDFWQEQARNRRSRLLPVSQEGDDMKLTSLLLFPLLLLLPAFQCNGRTVSRCELRDKLRERIMLSERTENLTDVALTLIVCHLEKLSQLNTGTVHIIGHRITTTTTPPTTTTTTTTTIPTTTVAANQTNVSNQTVNSNTTVPPAFANSTTVNTTSGSTTSANQTNISNQTVNSGLTNSTSVLNQTLSGVNNTSSDGGQDQDQEEEPLDEDEDQEEEPLDEDEDQEEEPLLEDEEPFDEVIGNIYNEEDSYLYGDEESTVDFHMEDWRRLMELLNEEENAFDEEQLRIADDKLSADGFGGGSEMFQVNWSLGYHGIFQLSDSYFCQSSARFSQNVCNSTCSAFTDDDFTNDLDCFVDSLYWLYVLRTVGYQCYETTNFFGQCD